MYVDEGITKKHFRSALALLKYMRTVTSPLDKLVEHKDYDTKVRHVAEECLRAAAKRPLTQVTDREAVITEAIKFCVRYT